jgi:hypothetical protein
MEDLAFSVTDKDRTLAVLLLRVNRGGSRDLVSLLDDLAVTCTSDFGNLDRFRISHRLEGSSPDFVGPNGTRFDGYDAAIEMAAEDEPLLRALSSAVGVLKSCVDFSSSGVVAGQEHLCKDDDAGSAIVVYCNHRLPSISVEEFRHVWRYEFATLARNTPSIRDYRQVHVDTKESDEIATAIGFPVIKPAVDGVAIETFDGFDGLTNAASALSEQNGEPSATMALEQRFTDVARSTGLLARVTSSS